MGEKRALFLDFYGTLVHEDASVQAQIVKQVAQASGGDAAQIAAFWQQAFQTRCDAAHGAAFVTQREIKLFAIQDMLSAFGVPLHAETFAEQSYYRWQHPPIFPETKAVLAACPVPVYIVSNIDREDVLAALHWHGLAPAGVFTSEDARAYKPRPEIFRLALAQTGLRADEVLHAGDSLRSDVQGAGAVGIAACWLNRDGLPVPEGVRAISSLSELLYI